MGTLGEGEPNTVGRAELMACVVGAESTQGNVVYITDCEILKKRQDRGWPTPRLGQGSNPDLWWRLSSALKSKQERSQCSDSERTSQPQTSSTTIMTQRSFSLADALANQRRVRRRCEVRQLNKWLGRMRWRGRFNDGLLRQTCQHPKPPRPS